MLEAVLSVDAPDEWRKELISKYHARIKIDDCHARDAGGCYNLIEIEVEPRHAEMVLSDLRANPTVQAVDLDEVEPGLLHGAVTTSVCLGCCTMVSTETFLVGVHMDFDGIIHQRIISKDRESVRQAIAKVESLGHRVTLEKLSTLDASSYLTSHQEDILQIAYDKGYFDAPKQTDLRELSTLFGISISTMSEVLRKAQKKVMQEYFTEGNGQID